MSVGGVLYELWWEILKISPNFPTNSKVKVSHACLWSYLWWATSEKWIIIIIAAPLYYNYHSTWGLHGGTVVGALASQWEDPGSNPALHLPVCQLGPKWPGNGSFEQEGRHDAAARRILKESPLNYRFMFSRISQNRMHAFILLFELLLWVPTRLNWLVADVRTKERSRPQLQSCERRKTQSEGISIVSSFRTN